MNQPEAAGILVERAGQFHRARVSIQTKSFHVGMLLSPFNEGASYAALMRHIELRGKTAYIVQHEKTSGRQRPVPEIQFSQG